MGIIHTLWQRCRQWSLTPSQRRRALELAGQVERAFCEHPRLTGESYWQHLWFTTTMAARFVFTMAVLMIHGLFPFLLTRAASTQIEAVYRIMKKRIPKDRRDVIDLDYQV
ncbi:MAG: DUF6356 family protein [Rickettsiales bacterium]